MKCMKLGDIIQRVAEKDVNDKLNHGWKYTSKSEWKQNVRDVNKSEKKDDEGKEVESL